MPEPVVIVDYDPDWPARYARLRDAIAPALGDLAAAIEHVGSTAVPGLAAKPTIDIIVKLRSPSDLARAVERLAGLGYAHEGDLGVAGREAFATPAGYAVHDHHLYVCTPDWRGFEDQVIFRDHLRAHAATARAYGDAVTLVQARRRYKRRRGMVISLRERRWDAPPSSPWPCERGARRSDGRRR